MTDSEAMAGTVSIIPLINHIMVPFLIRGAEIKNGFAFAGAENKSAVSLREMLIHKQAIPAA